MHFFVRGPNIAAVQDDAQAAKYANAGWEKVDCAAFMIAWEARDARDRLQVAPLVVSPPITDVPPGTVLERLPGGMVRFKG